MEKEAGIMWTVHQLRASHLERSMTAFWGSAGIRWILDRISTLYSSRPMDRKMGLILCPTREDVDWFIVRDVFILKPVCDRTFVDFRSAMIAKNDGVYLGAKYWYIYIWRIISGLQMWLRYPPSISAALFLEFRD